jgi:molybdenum cofactor cytidylyltransferase
MDRSSSRVVAVIPAAGLSRRMGQPKLLMPVGTKTVIEQLLAVLGKAGVDQAVVVCRRGDRKLQAVVEKCGATIVLPQKDPPDMRTSAAHALDWIRSTMSPDDSDGWMLIPADHPVLTAATVSQLIQAWKESAAEIVVPVYAGRRGHPTAFGWSTADQVASIPSHQGLNQLLRAAGNAILEVEVNDPTVLFDLDTPQDYERMIDLWGRA